MSDERIQIVGSAPEAVIRGKGVSVDQVVSLLADGKSTKEVYEVYPQLEDADVSAAVSHAALEAATLCEAEIAHILQ